MRINVEEVEKFIKKQSNSTRFRYRKAWNAFKNNANNVTAEELKELAIDFCKDTLEDKISAVGYNEISNESIREIVKETARIMTALKSINDKVIKIDGLLDELFIKTNRGTSFTDGIVKKKLREIVSEEKISLSPQDKGIVLDYLSNSKQNIVRFFGEDINTYFSEKSSVKKSNVNSFLNYVSPLRTEAIKILARDPKASVIYKSDSETLKNVNTDDVYNVCKKIIFEIMDGKDIRKINTDDKNRTISKIQDVLRHTSDVYDEFFKNKNPIKGLQESRKCKKLKTLCNNVFESITKEMSAEEVKKNKAGSTNEKKSSEECIYLRKRFRDDDIEEYSIASSSSVASDIPSNYSYVSGRMSPYYPNNNLGEGNHKTLSKASEHATKKMRLNSTFGPK
ncbi:MAG: hypothetical protein K6D38_03740 [Pseudobutyrivibrio sp.]|nr:hypothetical protein [Pseudobutyrivibrio sp.]